MLLMKNYLSSLFIVGLLFIVCGAVNAQTACDTARISAIGINNAPAQNEVWYKLSTIGQPLANYYINYDSKSLSVTYTIYKGSCDKLEILKESYIPATRNDTATYYIHFDWGKDTPQAFKWELYQSKVIPVTDIEVNPSIINMFLDETYSSTDLTITVSPSNATNPHYDVTTDDDDLLRLNTVNYPDFEVTALGTGIGTVILTSRDSNVKDTLLVVVNVPVDCGSAKTIVEGTNMAEALKEQWFLVTPEVSGTYKIEHPDMTPSGEKISADWKVYTGNCHNLRPMNHGWREMVVEAGKMYAIKLYQYEVNAFEWSLVAPDELFGFNLTTKNLELVLSEQDQENYLLADLGLNFLPDYATDKGVDIAVRDSSILYLNEDGLPEVNKDYIRPLKAGSTYVVFTTHDGGFQDSCKVVVKKNDLTGFSLSVHKVDMYTPYNNMGDENNSGRASRDTINIASLGLNFTPNDATDKRYSVTVRNKAIVKYMEDDLGNEYLQANHQGSTYVVISTIDKNLQDSVLVNVTRSISGGNACKGATIAKIGDNTHIAGIGVSQWYTFTPTESGYYAMTNKTTKYPVTYTSVYEGICDSLSLYADGHIAGGTDEAGNVLNYQLGFFATKDVTYYLKLTTIDYNLQGKGDLPYEYKWILAKVSASIKGSVMENDLPATGKVYLYRNNFNSTDIEQTVDLVDGNYLFENLGVCYYYIKVVTTDGNIAYYGDVVNSENARPIVPSKPEVLTRNITMTPKPVLNDGSASIEGYVILSSTTPKGVIMRSTAVVSGESAENVAVILYRNQSIVGLTQTNADGYYQFSNIGLGEYTVVVDVPGMEMEDVSNVTISNEEETVELNYTISEEGYVTEEIPTGMCNPVENLELAIYPNPVSTILTVSGVDGCTVNAYNLQGQLIYVKENLTDTETIEVSDWNKGIYLFKFQNGSVSVARKVVVQ